MKPDGYGYVSIEEDEWTRLLGIQERLLNRWRYIQQAKQHPSCEDYVDKHGTRHLNGQRVSYAGEETAIIFALGYRPEE